MGRMKLVIPAERCWLQVADATLDSAFQSLGIQAGRRLGFAAREALINALRIEEESGRTAESEIEVQVSAEDGWIELRVIDNGPGLPEGWQQTLSGRVAEDSVTSVSGRGLVFIQQFVDEIRSERDADGRHVLIMRKKEGERKA